MARTPSVASARPRRTPLEKRNRLSVRNKEDGFFYRIVNDAEDRVERLKEQGYEVCTAEQTGMIGDKRVDNASFVGSAAHFSVGQGTKAVVMRIPKDWHDEDNSMKQQEVDRLESTMKSDARKTADYGGININVEK